jgi:acyl-CoA oxidase
MAIDNRLIRERNAFPLDVKKLTEFLYGGAEEYEIYQQAFNYLLEKTDFFKEDYGFYDRSRADKRKKTFYDLKVISNITKDIKDPKLLQKVIGLIDVSKSGVLSRYALSVGFTGSGIAGQGTQEQADYYLPKLRNLQMTGAYCITELGTGSYVKAFQTTATFIPETDEFEINTPTITATKWWVGAAAQTATHGVVFARLLIQGKDYGVCNFVVQLRDENFALCKGVALGDVGPKRGCDGTDNGWLSFDHLRIPRTNMLMKWNQVDRDGAFTSGDIPQIAYGTLTATRVMIARQVVEFVKKAVTIATRYSIVRDQYTMEGKSLMDYTTQQERLIGGLCSAYAYQFATGKLQQYYLKVAEELMVKDISHLKELHNNSSAMKGFVALWGGKTINDCILSLGGHSYSELSDLPRLLADSAPTIPYEGDAILLVQQTASYLVKTAGDVLQGKPIDGDSIQYLKKLVKFTELKSTADPTKPLSLSEMKDAAQWLALSLIRESAMELMVETQKKGDKEMAWNACQLKLIEAARAHFMFSVLEMFQDVLENDLPKELGESGKDLLPIITQLAELFVLRHIQEFMHVFYENNYFPTTRGRLINEQVLGLYTTIRPYVAKLVDAWDLHDQLVGTPLGRFDGDVYEHYFKAVKSLPQETIPDYWNHILKPSF